MFNPVAHAVSMAANYNLGNALQGAMGQIGSQLNRNAGTRQFYSTLGLRKYEIDKQAEVQKQAIAARAAQARGGRSGAGLRMRRRSPMMGMGQPDGMMGSPSMPVAPLVSAIYNGGF